MKFYSTNHQTPPTDLLAMLTHGLAPDGGLFMPETIPKLSEKFLYSLAKHSLAEIGNEIAQLFLTEVPKPKLRAIIQTALNFPIPLRQLDKNLFVLELFHGPTLAFKDVGARFMARLLGNFLNQTKQTVNIIVATSGDTGSAVASGFYNIPGVKVYILYPHKRVSHLQEQQLTAYGKNIQALAVKGSFDDCQALAKAILNDAELQKKKPFSSANSINFGRLLPQSFYYFHAAAELERRGIKQPPVIVVPSGNFGNLVAGLMAKKMGLPVHQFLAATNKNNIVPEYLRTGKFKPRSSRATISNAMDVGNPSNFARLLDLYGHDYQKIKNDIAGLSISETKTKKTIRSVYKQYGYIADPHTAVGIAAAWEYQKKFTTKHPLIVLGTAHPAKFKSTVESITQQKIILPIELKKVLKKSKHAILVPNNLKDIQKILLKNL